MAYTPGTLKTYGPHGAMVSAAVAPEPDSNRKWHYKTEDAMTTVRAANYISDAQNRGMQVGDTVEVITFTAGVPSAATLAVVMAVAATGADLSDGLDLTVTNT